MLGATGRRTCAALLILLGDTGDTVRAADLAALRDSSEAVKVGCTDLGVQMHIRRSAAMPLEELSELQTGKACTRAAIMAGLADDAMELLGQAGLDVLDCVTTRIDEELLGLYAVMRMCDRRADRATDQLAAWDAHIRPQVERLFGSAGGTSGRLQYHRSLVLFENLVVSNSYSRTAGPVVAHGDDSEDLPKFRYKSTELWSVPAASNPEHPLILLKLKLKNEGSAPLHVFAATLKIVDGSSTNGALVLLPEKLQAVLPASEASVLLQVNAEQAVELREDASYAVYFAHTSSRAHILEGRLNGKKLKATSDKKKPSGKSKNDPFSVHKVDGASPLEAAYTRLPYSMWQRTFELRHHSSVSLRLIGTAVAVVKVVSIGIVMVVGIVTTLFMRRKWTRVSWSQSLDCFKHKTLKHKSSSLSKMTEMTPTGSSLDYEETNDADADALESDGFLPSSRVDSCPPSKKLSSTLRDKMPAITMQWKKPAILRNKLAGSRSLKLDSTIRLNPKLFETLWEDFIERHNGSFQSLKRPALDTFVQVMATVGIACMASGTVNGVEKYVLYAKQADSSDYFFVSVDIVVASSETSVSIRASKSTHESLVQQFIALVEKQLEILLK